METPLQTRAGGQCHECNYNYTHTHYVAICNPLIHKGVSTRPYKQNSSLPVCVYFHRRVLTFDIIIGTGSSLNYAIDKVKYAQLMAMTPISNVKTN